MKFIRLIATVAMLVPCMAAGQALVESGVVEEKVPEAAIASAVQAVGELGQAVVQGRYQVALERMNPKEKELLVKQMGGLEKLEEKLKGVPAEMAKKGVRIISSKPQGKPQAFAVTPLYVKPVEGKESEGRWYYSQWLVVVPTVTHYEVRLQPEGQPEQLVKIESLGFQVAVSDRDKSDWTFISGSGLTVGRLRNHYSTLPADIELPPVQDRQVQN